MTRVLKGNETGEANERALLAGAAEVAFRARTPEREQAFADGSDSLPLQPSDAGAKHPSFFETCRFYGARQFQLLQGAIATETARGTAFLFLPVFMGMGAVIYFTLPFEPNWTPLVALTCLTVLLRYGVRHHFVAASLTNLALAILVGLLAAKCETERRATQILGSDVTTYLTARVVMLEQQDKDSFRITLDVLDTARPQLRHAPQRVRVTAHDIPAATSVGSGLQGFVRLRMPSGPVRPGNYDFAFNSYFTGIGANGFFLGTPRLVNVPPAEGIHGQASSWIAALRVRISERVETTLAGEDGSVAAALITGIRAGISDKTNEDLRKAGLAHILSISGLHLALAAGVVMVSLRSLFALFPGFSLRYPVKKIAAFLSLLSCTFYLALSGADIAAQRSYIMIVVMLLAVLSDRRAMSMGNIAIAAMLTIAITPHEVLGPSFQMSFAATAALIAAYAWWLKRHAGNEQPAPVGIPGASPFASMIARPVFFTAATSIVAGAASGVFAAYHFNNTAPLGLVGNVLSLPAISLIIMPFGVLGLLLMPVELDWLPLQIMGFGVWLVRAIAENVAAWAPDGNPGAMPVPTLLSWALAIILLVTLTTWLRLLAVPLMVIGLVVFIRAPMPDILVSEDAKLVAVRLSNGDMALNQTRPSRFTKDNWGKAYLVRAFLPPRQSSSGAVASITDDSFLCEEGLCAISLRDGRMLTYTNRPAMEEAACNIGDIVVLAIPGKSLRCKDPDKLTITRQQLALDGAPAARAMTVLAAENDDGGVEAEMKWPERQDGLPVSRAMLTEDWSQPASLMAGDHGIVLRFAIGVPVRPWHEHRLHSRAARGLPDSYQQQKRLAQE